MSTDTEVPALVERFAGRMPHANASWPVATDPNDLMAMDRTKKGEPIPNALNCKRAIEAMLGWLMFELGYDEFLDTVVIRWREERELRPWKDSDIVRIQMLLQKAEIGLVRVSRGTVEDAARLVAERFPRNCVADWLVSLKWDGVRRLSELLPRGFGTASDRYHMRSGRNWLISMVARAMKPGCKVDTVTVLEGPQGALKSTALGIIGGDWYKELTARADTKDFEQQLRGVWLGEFAELATVRRPDDVQRLKQFITNRVDHYRPSYGRVERDYPRRIVFAGTTNESEYINDGTGGRRFIPVKVGRVDLEWLRENREQLFAEAAMLHKQGRKWWVWPAAAVRDIQEARQHSDPWEERIAVYLQGRTEVLGVSEVLEFGLGIATAQQTHAQVTRAGTTLSRLGCEQRRRRVDGRIRKCWLVPTELAQKPLVYGFPVREVTP